MPTQFIHDAAPQRVVFAPGAISQTAAETARLAISRALVIATPGSGERLGARIAAQLGDRAAGLHAKAVIHVPRSVAEGGLAAAKDAKADGLVAVGGGSAIGLAKIIARDTGLPILCVPTTYSGSEATPVWGLSDADRKMTGKDDKVLPRAIIYDPELTLALPPDITAASAMNAMAHCIMGMWTPDRTPVTISFATEAMRRFGNHLARAVANGNDIVSRSECLVASWLAGAVLTAGTGLNHKLAHVLGGYGLPHAQTHAVLLPHTTRFNLAADSDANARLAEALRTDDPAAALENMLRTLGIPNRLRDLGFTESRIPDAAAQLGAMIIIAPRPVSAEDAQSLLLAAF